MKFFFDSKTSPYTGKELTPLRNYLTYGLLGNSVVAWVGPCRVELTEMVDAEDIRSQSTISSDQMLHFIFELFDVSLAAGVLLQRLFAEMILTELKKSPAVKPEVLVRRGDDIYYGVKKLNVSIATKSVNSVLLHVGVNVSNRGTPIETCALSDFSIDPSAFAQSLMTTVCEEWQDILNATYKVFSVPKV